MNKLLLIIKAYLETKHERVYHEHAPSDAVFPYLVYEVTEGFKNGCRDDLTLIIDIWDRNQSSMEIEELTDTIDRLFDNANLPTDYVLPTFYRESRLKIEDPDKTLKRRQLRFSVQTYFK